MFESNPYSIRELSKGLVKDGVHFPDNSVQDCLNYDFPVNAVAERRLPYKQQMDLSEVLPSGYAIIAWTPMKYTDANGSVAECVVVSAKSDAGEMKIYINYWYSPSYGVTGYDNWQGYAAISSSTWVNTWVEVTERATLPTSGRTVTNGTIGAMGKNITYVAAGSFSLQDGYYNGWTIYNSSFQAIGVVTDYDYNYNGAGGIVFYCITSPYVFDYGSISSGSFDANAYYIARFPVNMMNRDVWDDITDVKFIPAANKLKITCGHESRTLCLQFIQAKPAFNSLELHLSQAHYRCHGNWNGMYFAYEMPNNDTKEDVVVITSGNDGTSTKPWSASYSGTWTYQGIEHNYTGNDIYTGYVALSELGMFLEFQLTYNLSYYNDGSNPRYGSDEDLEDLWGLSLELDNYQAMFLKMFLAKRFTVFPGGGTTFKFKNLLVNLTPIFRPDYDRRINATLLFYEVRQDFDDQEEKGYNPLQLSERYNGRKSINDDDYARNDTLNYWSVNLITYPQGWHNPYGQYTEPSNWDSDDEYKEEFFEDPENDGLLQNAYLNVQYWKDIIAKAKDIIKIGSNYALINISNDSVATETELEKNGGLKMIIGAVQQGNIFADGVWTDESVQQITTTEQLTGGASLPDEQFLIFSENGLYWRKINYGPLFLTNIQDYAFRGAYNKKGIVTAQIGDQFAGVYWVSKDSIYRFINNAPEDILEYRWKEYYQESVTENSKQNAVTGFNQRTKDVYFCIGTSIFIWNILTEAWKIYSFTDVPEYFQPGFDAEIWWSKGQILYSMDVPGTARWKDQASTGDAAIPFYLEKTITGELVSNKIADRFDLIYEITPETNLGEIITSQQTIQVGINGSITDIFDGTAKNGLFNVADSGTPGKFKFTQNTRIRKRANYLRMKLASVTANAGNIKQFKIKEILFNMLSGARKMGKI